MHHRALNSGGPEEKQAMSIVGILPDLHPPSFPPPPNLVMEPTVYINHVTPYMCRYVL